MKDKKFRRTTWQQLAIADGSSGGSPPGGTGRPVAGMPASDPTLTRKFNAAANKSKAYDDSQQPVTKKQIEILKRQMSQQRHTSEMTPLGSVLRSRNVEKDRRLIEAMTALTERLNKQKRLSQRFATAEKKGHAKQQFNKSARGIGM